MAGEPLISVAEATRLVLSGVHVMPVLQLPLADASGHALAADIIAPCDHPGFDQSAVDGYAICYADWKEDRPFRVEGYAAAGETAELSVKEGIAVRIFTGGRVPDGADTVVMQEFSRKEGDSVYLDAGGWKAGSNVRKAGEQVRRGTVALQKGHVLDPAALGFLGSLGVVSVSVHAKPRVAVIVTGNEFAPPGTEPVPGLIFESNSVMIAAALQGKVSSCSATVVQDDPGLISTAVRQASLSADVIIMTGGVSVGDLDHTRPCLEGEGFEIVFHKVNQKPGKPVLFARKGHIVVFGLPGNPRSALVCLEVYAIPYLRASMGYHQTQNVMLRLPLAESYSRKGNRAEWLACEWSDGGIRIRTRQDSHMLQSLSGSFGLAFLSSEMTELRPGDLIEVWVSPAG